MRTSDPFPLPNASQDLDADLSPPKCAFSFKGMMSEAKDAVAYVAHAMPAHRFEPDAESLSGLWVAPDASGAIGRPASRKPWQPAKAAVVSTMAGLS